MTAEPLTPEEAARAVIDTWRGQRSHMPVAIRDLEVALDAARKASPPLDVERLALVYHAHYEASLDICSHDDPDPAGWLCRSKAADIAAEYAALDPTP